MVREPTGRKRRLWAYLFDVRLTARTHRQPGGDQRTRVGDHATECLPEIHDMLAATERGHTAAMASKARPALTKIHMHAAGIDPARPRVRGQ